MAEIVLKIKHRYDTAARWTAQNPILLAGEIGIESDTRKAKVGDGTSRWRTLAYAFSDGAVIPTKTSDLTNDSGFITLSDVTSELAGYLPLAGGTITGPIHFNGTPDAMEYSTFLTQETNYRCMRLWGGTEGLSGVLALYGLEFIAEGGSYSFGGAACLGACDANGNVKWFKPEASGQLSYNNIPLARYCLPSTSYKNLSLPSSGGTVTASDDGWVLLEKAATAAGQYIYLQTPSLRARAFSTGANTLDIYVPVCKGDTVQVNYSAAGTLGRFRFYYSIGSEWAA
ncbi:MAG: hypothetical protein KIG68_09405 [Oxalobacter sp.]|nr:hypothetical protein [Oxalobacter sp.]